MHPGAPRTRRSAPNVTHRRRRAQLSVRRACKLSPRTGPRSGAAAARFTDRVCAHLPDPQCQPSDFVPLAGVDLIGSITIWRFTEPRQHGKLLDFRLNQLPGASASSAVSGGFSVKWSGRLGGPLQRP